MSQQKEEKEIEKKERKNYMEYNITYSNYIMPNELLKLQNSDVKGGRNHHDEHLFLVVHQSFELWFAQILHELTNVRDILQNEKLNIENIERICSRAFRAEKIMNFSLGIFDILETMSPLDFLEFRDFIGPASGFQSVQNREIEILLGLEDKERQLYYGKHYATVLKHDKEGLSKIEKRLKEKSLKDVVYDWLSTLHDKVPNNFLDDFKKAKKDNLYFQKKIWYKDEDKIKQEVEKEYSHFEPFINQEGLSDNVRKRRITLLYISCYKYDDEITRYSNLLDSLVAFEESLILWKTRHARMVERMIGKRIGTGGSSGVEYLDKTTEYRVFQDLWQVRNHYIRPSSLPKH
eukprot:gene10448-2970_t